MFDQLTYWWMAAIGAVFFLGLLFLEVPLLFRWASLRLRNRRIRRLSKTQAYSLPRQIRPKILRELRKSSWLKEPSEEFERSWRSGLLEEEDAALGEVQLIDFLPPEKVIPSAANRHLALVLPGILVALGIVGTFVGLVKGLPAIGTQNLGASPTALRDLVSTITSSLGLAFYTSIVGISASMIFLALDRLFFHGIEHQVRVISALVEKGFPVLSSREMRRLQHSILKETSANIQTLATDISTGLADAIGPAFDKAIGQHMAPAVQSIQESVDRLVSFSSEKQLDGMEKVVDKFLDSMQANLGDHFNELETVLQTTVQSQQQIGSGLSEFAVQLREVSETQGELIDRTTRAASTLADSLDRLEAISSILGEAAEKILAAGAELELSATAAMDAQRSASVAQKALLEASKEQSAAMDDAREGLVQAWSIAVEQAKGAISQIQEASRELSEGIGDQLILALQTFDGALGETIQRFSGTLTQVDSSIGELPPAADALKASSEALETRMKDILQVVEKTRELVDGAVSHNIERAMDAATRMEGAAQVGEGLATKTERLQVELSNAAESLRQMSTQMITTGEQFSGLNSTMSKLDTELPAISESMSKISKSLDGGDPFLRVSGRLERLSKNLEELTVVMLATSEQLSEKKGLSRLWGGWR